MAEQGKPQGPGSRIIRERAMNILRETRAKIDPKLLAVMKEKLSAVMPPGMLEAKPPAEALPVTPPTIPNKDAAMPLSIKAVSPAKPPSVKEVVKADETSEPVDREKIAKIVLDYMKRREKGGN